MRQLRATPELCPAPTRRHVLAGAGALAAVASGTVALAATAPAGDDAPLFDLIHRWHETEELVQRLWDHHDELCRLLPDRFWTPEEMEDHHIDGKNDKPRYVSLEDIEKNDRWDHPGQAGLDYNTTDDGTTMVQTITHVRRTASQQEIAAWRTRCAARKALYDAKQAAYKEAKLVHGVDAAEERAETAGDERQRILDAIKAYRPVTLAGVLAKMRVYRENDHESFDGEPDEWNWSQTLFMAALADLERMVGAAA